MTLLESEEREHLLQGGHREGKFDPCLDREHRARRMTGDPERDADLAGLSLATWRIVNSMWGSTPFASGKRQNRTWEIMFDRHSEGVQEPTETYQIVDGRVARVR